MTYFNLGFLGPIAYEMTPPQEEAVMKCLDGLVRLVQSQKMILRLRTRGIEGADATMHTKVKAITAVPIEVLSVEPAPGAHTTHMIIDSSELIIMADVRGMAHYGWHVAERQGKSAIRVLENGDRRFLAKLPTPNTDLNTLLYVESFLKGDPRVKV